MNKYQDRTAIAVERTQDTNGDPQYSGSEHGGLLFNSKTAQEWFSLHEVMRKDFERILRDKETLQESYDRVLNSLKFSETMGTASKGVLRPTLNGRR